MNKENTMNEAQKIAQALAAIPADFQDKALRPPCGRSSGKSLTARSR
jgi:hypothetical protein